MSRWYAIVWTIWLAVGIGLTVPVIAMVFVDMFKDIWK